MKGKKYNDQHIIGIVIISKCKLVFTLDKGLRDLIKDRCAYPKRFRRPHIYSSEKNRDLLIDKNIVKIECE